MPFLKCTVSRRLDECFRIQCVELLRPSAFSSSKDDPSKITAVAEPENLRGLSGETIFVKVLCKPKVPLIAVRFLGGGGVRWVTRVLTSSDDVTSFLLKSVEVICDYDQLIFV